MTVPRTWTLPAIAGQGDMTGATAGQGPTTLTAPIPAGVAAVLVAGFGAAPVEVTAIDDTAGNPWLPLASNLNTPNGRSSAIGYCPEVVFPLAAGATVYTRGVSGINTGTRIMVLNLGQPAEATGTAVSPTTTNSAPALGVPAAQAGELIVAGLLAAGNLILTNPAWPLVGTSPGTAPTLHAFGYQAAGSAQFTGSLSAANYWSMTAARFAVPVREALGTLKVWDGTGWRPLDAPGARVWDGADWGRLR